MALEFDGIISSIKAFHTLGGMGNNVYVLAKLHHRFQPRVSVQAKNYVASYKKAMGHFAIVKVFIKVARSNDALQTSLLKCVWTQLDFQPL